MKRILVAVATLVVCVFAAPESRAASTGVFNDEQERAIEQIVRRYLLENPELLEEVIAELRKKREAEAAVARREYLGELYGPESKYAKYSMGEGDVVVVELMDYNCPYCRKAYSVLRDLSKDSNIQVRFVEFPVLGPMSTTSAQAALAAQKQGKYAAFHGALMSINDRIESREQIFDAARKVGLDVDKLKKDMQDPEILSLIDENLQLAEQLGVQGTPAFFVGDTVIPGAPDNLKEALKQAIAEAKES
jgi:protein-disulfide isomerase